MATLTGRRVLLLHEVDGLVAVPGALVVLFVVLKKYIVKSMFLIETLW